MSITKRKRDKIREEIITLLGPTPSPSPAQIDAILKRHLAPGIKPRSAKNKGRGLQNWLRDQILQFLEMFNIDDPEHVRSTSMGAPGEDLLLSPTARTYFPFAPECKSQEKIGFWPAVDQAESNAGNYTPMVVFKKNHTLPWIAIPADQFFTMLYAATEATTDRNTSLKAWFQEKDS